MMYVFAMNCTLESRVLSLTNSNHLSLFFLILNLSHSYSVSFLFPLSLSYSLYLRLSLSHCFIHMCDLKISIIIIINTFFAFFSANTTKQQFFFATERIGLIFFSVPRIVFFCLNDHEVKSSRQHFRRKKMFRH